MAKVTPVSELTPIPAPFDNPLRMIAIPISYNETVLVVEDSNERIQWFRKRLPNATYRHNAEDALAVLSNFVPEVVFLDCDLTFSDVAYPNQGKLSGIRVAAHLSRTAYAGRVVIHSVNQRGAREMSRLLPRATLAPFGTFEIVMAFRSKHGNNENAGEL